MKTYFVSGHLDLTEAEFAEHYVPRLEIAVSEGARFIVGDARGADTLAQKWLAALRPLPAVSVFHMFERPRNLFAICAYLHGGYQTDEQRDAAMTALSDDDIAWVRPGRESSGTARNLARRS